MTEFVHGLVISDESRTYSNWGLSRTTKLAVYLEPISYADVQFHCTWACTWARDSSSAACSAGSLAGCRRWAT
jgi:hypothetical protein